MADRQLILQQKNANEGWLDYLFYLYSPYGAIVLKYIPDGWKDEVVYERNDMYHSVLRSYSVNELTFVKEGRDFLQEAYENGGISSEVSVVIYKLNKNIWAHVRIYSGIIDMSTYFIDEFGVKVQLLDNSFTEKFKSREGLKVNLYDLVTVEGMTLSPFTFEGADSLYLPDLDIDLYAELTYIIEILINANYGAYTNLFSVPSNIVKSQFTETIDIAPLAQAGSSPISNTPSPLQDYAHFYDSSNKNAISIRIHGSITISSTYTVVPAGNYGTVLVCRWNAAEAATLQAINIFTMNGVVSNQVVAFDETFTVEEGQSVGIITTMIDLGAVSVTYHSVEINIVEINAISLAARPVRSYPIYEALLRTIQKITDKVDCLESEFFGRVDTPISTYPLDGQLGNITIGKSFRGVDIQSIPVSIKDLFLSLDAIFNIGLGISDSGKIVIEEFDYFLDENVILDLSDRISENLITKEVKPDLFFNKVVLGYAKFTYETSFGLGEINTKNEYSTEINSLKNVYSRISNLRGDTQGTIKLRLKPASLYPDEDVQGDEDVFIVDSYRGWVFAVSGVSVEPTAGAIYSHGSSWFLVKEVDLDSGAGTINCSLYSGSGLPAASGTLTKQSGTGDASISYSAFEKVFNARTDELFSIVTGEFNGYENYFNLNLSPMRNFLRHGSHIRAGLEKELGTNCKFQFKDKDTSLSTQLVTESTPKAETDDYLIYDLGESRFIPEIYRIEAPFYIEDYAVLEANRHGIIKLADDKYGWIYRVQTNNDDRKAEFELLRVNLNVVTPVEL